MAPTEAPTSFASRREGERRGRRRRRRCRGGGRSRAGARRSEAATARPSGSPQRRRRRRGGLPRQPWSPPRGASAAPAAARRAAPTEHAQRCPSRRTEFRSEIPLLRVFVAAARGAGSSAGGWLLGGGRLAVVIRESRSTTWGWVGRDRRRPDWRNQRPSRPTRLLSSPRGQSSRLAGE